MSGRGLRGAIVGASTLLGKELVEELKDAKGPAWELTLLDAEEMRGQVASAGDEAVVIQPVSAGSFAGVDVVFFVGNSATTREHWSAAQAAGAGIVDLTGSLEREAGVLVRSTFAEGAVPDLATVAVVTAHPMAVVLALVEARLRPLGLARLAATVLLPASEMGDAGVDELQQQAVGLLTFKPLHKDVYDAQVAFNLLSTLGGAAKIELERVRSTILRQVALLASDADRVVLQVVQAPVFHGFTASIFVEMAANVDTEDLRKALRGGVLRVADEISPSNEAVAGASEVLLSLGPAGMSTQDSYWLWLAADNLRFAARDAAGCGRELAALKPMSRVN